MARQTGITMVPRTVAIDDALRRGPGDQVVVLGAGLDSRARRMPELARATVFEVDQPSSQADKLRRVGDRPPLAAVVRYVAVDLATDPLAPGLTAAGFRPDRPSTWVWEGVIPYLAPAAVRATLAQVAALSSPGSSLVLNYQARSLVAAAMRGLVRLVLRLSGQVDPLAGEPWRSLWSPRALGRLLEQAGYRVVSAHDLRELAEGLALPAVSAGALRLGRVAVATRTDR